MDAAQLSQTLQQDALWIVFLNVLLQQIGLPVPAVPTLLFAGSLAATPGQFGKLLAAAMVASMIADWVWYRAGQLFGYRVLSGLCRLSINPGSCVSQTEARFLRWGLKSLVVAKFLPGFAIVAPPIAGALRMKLLGFLAAAGVGAGLWAGLALLLGQLFHDSVQQVVALLSAEGERAALAVLVVVGLWLAWKFWQKYRFRQTCGLPHISVEELMQLRRSGQPLLLLDLRGATMVRETGPIDGGTVAEHDRLFDAVGTWPKAQAIVTLCACPEDAGAIQAANRLREAGYLSVRPVKGGYEAWVQAGN
ncbi:MAG TPA: VTT domain-containing protein [Rhodocyclaceae bacterium]|jgi:membrane protein DedA with SNARE-associated domain/rhodanese-related sulfurtransferase|nr:VTT domain-containing protein [Rhodocyclaceae bacterium]